MESKEYLRAKVKNRIKINLKKHKLNTDYYDEYFASEDWEKDIDAFYRSLKSTKDIEREVEIMVNFIEMNY